MTSATHGVAPLIARRDELTHVELLWIKKQFENRIRFGRSVEQHIIDRQWRVVSFEAGSIFAFVRWAGNEYGTTLSRIDILRAASPGQARTPERTPRLAGTGGTEPTPGPSPPR